MPLERKRVGPVEKYLGRNLTARYMGPDLLAYVDDVELNAFYPTRAAAIEAGKRHVDAEEKSKKKK